MGSWAMKPSFFDLNPCSHLSEFRDRKQSYNSLQIRIIPIGRVSIVKIDNSIPRCSVCSLFQTRLYLCLICQAVSCADHANTHCELFRGHEIAVDIDRAELFCCSCRDQVYDPDFDNEIMAKQLLELPKSSESHNRRKRRFTTMVEGERGSRKLVLGLCRGVENRACHPLGIRGLNNLGSTCFMNSVLQVLLHAPPMKNYFSTDWHRKDVCVSRRNRKKVAVGKELLCLACSVDGLFLEMFSGNSVPYSPGQFLYSWWQHSSNLASYEQQDAHEFFISILDLIHEEQTNQHNKGIGDCHCIAHRVFSGVLRSDVTCTVCGFTSTTHDPFVDLSLDLEPYSDVKSKSPSHTYTLMGCLDLFTRPEKLGSEQKYFCENCKIRQDSVKQLSIRKLPLVLCFHIKRFEHSLAKRTAIKIDKYLQFPFSLDMAPYLSYSIIRNRFGNRIFAFEGDELEMSRDLSSEYEVFAVVSHSGRMESGHYLTYLRVGDQWYRCNDAQITNVSEGVVRAAQGYMIYYVQKLR